MDKEVEREKIIKRLMRQSNMSRESAAFAADIEMGALPGDIIDEPETPEEKGKENE